MASGIGIQIEKLGKDNYDTWKQQMGAILVKNDHWEYVMGIITKPEADAGDIAKWEKADQKAKADIILAIQPSELCHIKGCTTSSEVWNKLEQVYQSKGPAKKATLLKKLLFTKMSEGENMADHLTNFMNTVDKLKEMDILMSEELLTIILLYSVPDSYDNFRCAIETRDELPGTESLKVKLLEEYNARKNKEESEKTGAYLAGQFKQQKENKAENIKKSYVKQEKPSNQKFRFKCHYCSNLGHKASECRKKERDRKLKSQGKEEAYTVKDERVTSCAFNASVAPASKWCVDSGATSHMCQNDESFSSLTTTLQKEVGLATNNSTRIEGKGTVHLDVCVKEESKRIRLDDVLLVPELKTNLFSIVKGVKGGRTAVFTERDAVLVNRQGEILLTAARRGDLYYIEQVDKPYASRAYEKVRLAVNDQSNTSESETQIENNKPNALELWHKRYGHLNEADLRKLALKNMVTGMKLRQSDALPTCKTCLAGKQTANAFPRASLTQTKRRLELIHSDVCGPMREKSIGGALYFATFIDDYSNWVEVHILKSKNEVKNAFLKFQALAENHTESKVKILRTDNGLEYCGSEFNACLEKDGIKRQRTVAYTPQQNGKAERMNRTLVEMARCLLIESGLPSKFWAEAIVTAAYIRNRCPSKSLNEKTPFEIWNQCKPMVSHLRIFGSPVFILNKNPAKGKFDNRSTEGIFVGYADDAKAYRIWDPKERKIHKSRDVQFLESSNERKLNSNERSTSESDIIYFYDDQTVNEPYLQMEKENEQVCNDIQYEKSIQDATWNNSLPTATLEGEESTSSGQMTEDTLKETPKSHNDVPVKRGPGRPTLERTGKRGRPRKIFHTLDVIQENTAFVNEDDTQSDIEDEMLNLTVSQALGSSHATEWKRAMEDEFNSLESKDVWVLTKRPKGKKIIRCKWVLRIKYDADGNVERHKARLVALGCSQQPGIDFKETFSPVTRQSSIRTITALAVELNLKMYHLDVVMAYINGKLEEEIYMEQAEGFIDPHKPDHVYRLKKSIYGLKQSGRQWFKELNNKLIDFGLKQMSSDKCVYLLNKDKMRLIVAVYVDDLIIACNHHKIFINLKNHLDTSFQIKDLGKINYCLGIEFHQDEESISMSQRKYINDILTKFKMTDCKPTTTPLDRSIKLTKELEPKNEEEAAEMKKIPYQRLIGSLMYLATSTRPDIANTVSLLSQFNKNPGRAHWIAAKRVLRYLKGTMNLGLKYCKTGHKLVGYVDADWGGCPNDRKSYTGYVFELAGAAITWESRKQPTVALSSTEAEYMALTEAAKEAVHLRKFLMETGVLDAKSGETVIYCDNQGAQKLMKNPVYHSRTKHIDIRHHFVREVYERGEIEVKYLPTEDMKADVLTKILFGPRHRKCVEKLGLTDCYGKRVERGC